MGRADEARGATYELGIEAGEVVTPGGRSRAHVYISDGRIAAVGPERHPARERVDASGLLVMPGMVDAHVHFMDPGDPEREDFPHGTAAAARSGVTTVIEHTHGAPVVSAGDLHAKREHLVDRARVDFALAAHAWPDRIDEVPAVWEAGAAFVKIFTCATHGLPGFDPARLEAVLRRAGECGAICLVHAEDESLCDATERALHAAHREDGGVIPAWRNRAAELVALGNVGVLAHVTGARTVAAHVSHPDAIGQVARERAAGAPVRIETCPQYLTLFEDEVLEHGAFRKFTPPARARDEGDLAAMWTAVADGTVDYVSSDHAPSTPEQKRAGSIWDVHFGLPGIDTTFSALLDGAHAGRLPYERVVGVYAEGPARTYGLFPVKGSLQVGADADVVLVDPEQRWTVRDADVLSKASWSPYSGRTFTGRAVRTYVRGTLVAESGRVLAEPGFGRFVSRA